MKRRVFAFALAALLAVGAGPPRPITVFVAGDSTAAPKRADRRPETGWAEVFQSFFDPDEVRVVNLARNGRSTRTFIEEGRWDALVEEIRPGDYVLIQFGHNDESETKPDRYTPPDAFRANLARFVADVRARAATPVLLTPVVRRRFDAEGQFYDVHGVYPGLTRAVAAEMDVALVDLHRASEKAVRGYGAEGSKALFLHLAPGDRANYPDGLTDDTHFSPVGARLVARLAAEGLAATGLPLARLVHLPAAPQAYSAVVDAGYAGENGAAVEGVPHFQTVGAALAAIP